MFVQCRFVSGTTQLKAFVENNFRLRPGAAVGLKDNEPSRWWTVVDVSQPVKRETIKRGWNKI